MILLIFYNLPKKIFIFSENSLIRKAYFSPTTKRKEGIKERIENFEKQLTNLMNSDVIISQASQIKGSLKQNIRLSLGLSKY